MSYNLLLDDIRTLNVVRSYTNLPSDLYPWILVRNYDEFKTCIENEGIPNFVSYDHDLSDYHYKAASELHNDGMINYDLYTEKTGYHCAKWLVDKCINENIKHPPYTVHSMNPIGKANIISYIESYNNSKQ